MKVVQFEILSLFTLLCLKILI